jgi:hypothetical protein
MQKESPEKELTEEEIKNTDDYKKCVANINNFEKNIQNLKKDKDEYFKKNPYANIYKIDFLSINFKYYDDDGEHTSKNVYKNIFIIKNKKIKYTIDTDNEELDKILSHIKDNYLHVTIYNNTHGIDDTFLEIFNYTNRVFFLLYFDSHASDQSFFFLLYSVFIV